MQQNEIFYRVGKNKTITLTVDNEQQIKIIQELNREFEKTQKSNKTYKARCVSVEALQKDGIEIKSPSQSVDELIINNEQSTFTYNLAHNVLKILTERQKQIMIMHFWENRTFREIAKILGIHFTTVAESYHSSLKKIKKFLKNTPTNH